METTTFQDEALIDGEGLLLKAGLQPGMTVADMGVGRSAIFTLAASKIVTDAGVVYSLDVVRDVLSIVDTKVQMAGCTNVFTVWTDLEKYGAATRVIDGSVDMGVLSDILFQSKKQEDILKEAVRMLKEGGKLLIVDWKTTPTSIGPPIDHRVSPESVKKIAEHAGLQFVEEFDAGEYHWGLLFQK